MSWRDPRPTGGPGITPALVAAALLGSLAVFLFAASTARAATSATDPQGDVLSCSGECSLYDQDLKSIALSVSGGNLLVTVEQYGTGPGPNGPFTNALKLYWPILDLYTISAPSASPPACPPCSGNPPDFNVQYQPGPYHMELVKFSGGLTPQHIVNPLAYTNPDANSVVYTVPLAKIGSAANVRVRAWSPGTGDVGSHKVVDVVPDSGLVGIATGLTGGFGAQPLLGLGGPTKVPLNGAKISLPVKNSNGFAINGTLGLAAPAASLQASAAGRKSIGSKAFHAAPQKTVTVKVKLTGKARKALAAKGSLKVTETATVHDPAGATRRVSRKIKLIAGGS